jgi:hypothetical protein
LRALDRWKIRGERRQAAEDLDRANALASQVPMSWLDFDFMRYAAVQLWLELQEPHRALRYLETYAMYDWLTNVRYDLLRGRAYEMLGQNERALHHYRRFVFAWQDCDPELRPLWDEGRAAVQRLQALEKL